MNPHEQEHPQRSRPTSNPVSEAVCETPRQSQAQVLETARELDRLGRRIERFLSLQLQQLEMAMASFDRERAAWQRQKQREHAELEKGRKELATTQEKHKAQRKGTKRFFGWGRDSEQRSSVLFDTDAQIMLNDTVIMEDDMGAAGTGTAPLKLLIQPGSVGEMRLGVLLLEISRLNRELGGGGVRFEMSACRVPRKRGKSSGADEEENDAIVQLEAFSWTPLVAFEGERNAKRFQEDVVNWERFKNAMLLTSLIDHELAQHFRSTKEADRDNPARALVLDAARRVDEANIKAGNTEEKLAAAATHRIGVEPFSKQLKRVEAVSQVLAEDCTLRIHASLV